MKRLMILKLVGICFAGFSCFYSTGQNQVSFSVIEKEGMPMLVISIEDEQLNNVLAREEASMEEQLKVYVGHHAFMPQGKIPPMLGNAQFQAGRIIFRPLISFRSGLTYTAFFQEKTAFQFTIPKDTSLLRPQVAAIYPKADTLPANQLKFYLYFSIPMAEGHAYRDLVLIDDQGDTVSAPFVHLTPELWNLDYTRLTLWVDPGRVKRALGPNQEEGAPLKEGRQYTLKVLPAWKSRQGQTLAKAVQKNFEVRVADRQKPETAHWRLEPPSANTPEVLALHFGESMDHALAQQAITIWRKDGKEVPGTVELLVKDQVWHFNPESPWVPGRYQIRIAAKLEDLAGNNLNRLFDRDLFLESNSSSTQEYYYLEFSVN